MPSDPEVLREALRAVIDPELGDDIVDLGMVRSISVGPDATVDGRGGPDGGRRARCATRSRRDVRGRLASLPGVGAVEVTVGQMDAAQRAEVMARARWKAREEAPPTAVPADTRVLAVASGKGGVGKSSVTVNLAVALARRGLMVGRPRRRHLGVLGAAAARDGRRASRPARARWSPSSGRWARALLRVLSMGFLADEDRAIMWRGLVLNRAVQQFLEDAHWGDLDYLLIDLPPGTGDVQMGLARMLPRTEMLVVTTPPTGGPEGGRPGRRHGPPGLPPGGRGDREHERLHLRARHDLRAVRHRGRRAGWPTELGVPLVGTIPLHPDVASGG